MPRRHKKHMTIIPTKNSASDFRRAARTLHESVWRPARTCVDLQFHNCPLHAITRRGNSTRAWVEFHLARAFFTELFRPKNQNPMEPWWAVEDYDGTVIALLLAGLIAKDLYKQGVFILCESGYQMGVAAEQKATRRILETNTGIDGGAEAALWERIS